MQGLDTNILVRWLVRDDPIQAGRVERLLQSGDSFLVPVTVLIELEWVLRSRYGVPKERFVELLGNLLEVPVLKLQHEAAIERALQNYSTLNVDFSDCVHLGMCAESECLPFLTFDKAATRLVGAEFT